MKSFLGTWTSERVLGGDVSSYKFFVSDGWLILQYIFVDNYTDGALSEKRSIDYTYKDGKFYFTRNYPPAYNDMTLRLKEGSLEEIVDQEGTIEGKPYRKVYTVIYEPDF